ncbi:MAG: hypothetical protein V1870_02680 [Candidatus Aenigmatarchaeota archaeon]
MNKRFLFSLIFIFLIIAVSGCINQQEEPKRLYNITQDGVEYIFLNNIYDTMNMTIEDSVNVNKTLYSPLKVIVAFNGSSTEDNAYFSVVSYNLVEKLKNHYIYTRGILTEFEAINLEEKKPSVASTIIVLKGPNTGANSTRIYYDNACIVDGVMISQYSRCVIIEGADYNGLVIASERLVLFLMDYETK